MIRKALSRRVHIVRLVIRLYLTFKRIERFNHAGGHHQDVKDLYADAGRRICETATRLCGAMVKVGQFLGTRDELFPAAFTRELQSLHDRVPAIPFTAVIGSRHASGYDDELLHAFSHVDEIPVASASLAQVHRAQLTNGQRVAMKILRPGIEETVRIDLSTLERVARFLNRIPRVRKRMDFVALHATFSNTLAKELDMTVEAAHLRHFQKLLHQDTSIVTPQVYEAYTSRRILVMSYLPGLPIRDISSLQLSIEERCKLRDALLVFYLKQIFVHGLVHLDPHPGNLLVREDGTLCLLDFGMIGEFKAEERAAFRQLIQSVFWRNRVGIVEALEQLGFLDFSDVSDERQTRKQVEEMVQSIMGQFDLKVLKRLLIHPLFRVQARYMLLVRCLGLLKSALTTLTPEESDWFGLVSEHIVPILLQSQTAQV